MLGFRALMKKRKIKSPNKQVFYFKSFCAPQLSYQLTGQMLTVSGEVKTPSNVKKVRD